VDDLGSFDTHGEEVVEVIEDTASGPLGGPGGEIFVHRVSEFLERAFVWQRLPAWAPITWEAIPASPERSQAGPGISAMLVSAADDQVPTSRGHVQATRGRACVEQRL
jgi:hypothetical protein